MQDFGAEVSQLRSLFELQLVDGLRLVYHTRVVVVHTVDVGPDLDFLSVQCSTDERSGVVRTAALQVVYLAVGIAADESLRDIHLLSLVLLHDGSQLFLDVDGVGLGVLVSTHEVESVEQYSLDALFLHIVYHHVGRHHLALCHDGLFLERGENFLGERAQIVELVLQEVAGGLFGIILGEELIYVLHVLRLQSVDNLVGAVGILFVEIVRDFHQRVGGSRHSREYNEYRLAALGDEICNLFHSLRRSY